MTTTTTATTTTTTTTTSRMKSSSSKTTTTFLVILSFSFCILLACLNLFDDKLFFNEFNPYTILKLSSSLSSSSSSKTTTTTTTTTTFNNSNNNILSSQQQNYIHSNNMMMYGHVHIAKTGGTTINALFANTFERVCGNKGNSYKQYQVNERAKETLFKLQQEQEQEEHDENKTTTTIINSIRFHGSMETEELEDIGFENCDYISNEVNWKWWVTTFGKRNSSFHGIPRPMELHIPCRTPIEHLMSQCNYWHVSLECGENATHMNRKAFIESVRDCFTFLDDRYQHDLLWQFVVVGENNNNNVNTVKCYDFEKQFTTYVDYMSQRLQPRFLISTPFVQLDTNSPRNKSTECIWNRPDLLNKTNQYLLKHVPYYQFCNACMGSDDEIAL